MTDYKFLRLSARARKELGQHTPRNRNPNEALPRDGASWKNSQYDGAELQPDPSIEPGRMVAHQLPSRVGERLYWPDGRITDLDHIEVTE